MPGALVFGAATSDQVNMGSGDPIVPGTVRLEA